MNIKNKKIKVLELPGMDITMPLFSFGTGTPKISIIAGMHGNEETGLMIIKKVFDYLSNKELKGTLQVLPSCNSLAQGFGSRVIPGFDYKDLNRQFPGSSDGQFIPQLANKIFNLIKDSTCVIDLHTFNMLCPIVGVFCRSKDLNKNQRVLKAIMRMEIDMIWEINTESMEDIRFKGDLADALKNTSSDYISLETPKIYRITENELNRSVKSILNLLRYYGCLKGNIGVIKDVPIVKRFDLRSVNSGLFLPIKRPLKLVKKGEIIGEIYSLKNYKVNKIKSVKDGLVMMIRDKSLVSSGDKLLAIGKIIN